jgi:hypothetical protein
MAARVGLGLERGGVGGGVRCLLPEGAVAEVVRHGDVGKSSGGFPALVGRLHPERPVPRQAESTHRGGGGQEPRRHGQQGRAGVGAGGEGRRSLACARVGNGGVMVERK